MPRQAVSGTENWRAAGNHANALEKLGFCADLDRLLAQAKPLTVGPPELTCLEFGSPSATLLRKKTENLGENLTCVARFGQAGTLRPVGHRTAFPVDSASAAQ